MSRVVSCPEETRNFEECPQNDDENLGTGEAACKLIINTRLKKSLRASLSDEEN